LVVQVAQHQKFWCRTQCHESNQLPLVDENRQRTLDWDLNPPMLSMFIDDLDFAYWFARGGGKSRRTGDRPQHVCFGLHHERVQFRGLDGGS
jgi:hypothetical protein